MKQRREETGRLCQLISTSATIAVEEGVVVLSNITAKNKTVGRVGNLATFQTSVDMDSVITIRTIVAEAGEVFTEDEVVVAAV